MTEFDKIRAAVVGLGRISGRHISAIESNETMDLVAVCDVDASRLENAKAEYGLETVKLFSSLEEMLEAEKLDCVAICTPSGLHPAQTKMAAKYGVSVITEKPMATKWVDGLSMVDACKRANVQLFVVKQNRYNETLRFVKQLLVEKRLGRLYSVAINVFWTRPQDYYDMDAWRGTWRYDGGALMNQASHYVDLLDWMIGPVESVQAMVGTLARVIEVEDTAAMLVKWRNGAIGTMNVSMLTYPKNYEGSITILGEKGTIKIGGAAVNEIVHFDVEGMEQPDLSKINYKIDSVYGNGHQRYYQNVSNTLLGNEKADVDGGEGLKSLELLIAAYRSARDRKTVSLPLDY